MEDQLRCVHRRVCTPCASAPAVDEPCTSRSVCILDRIRLGGPDLLEDVAAAGRRAPAACCALAPEDLVALMVGRFELPRGRKALAVAVEEASIDGRCNLGAFNGGGSGAIVAAGLVGWPLGTTRAGYLLKKSPKGPWQQRWFVLAGCHAELLYYPTHTAALGATAVELGRLWLARAAACYGKGRELRIMTPLRKWRLRAPTVSDARDWAAALEIARQAKALPTPPPRPPLQPGSGGSPEVAVATPAEVAALQVAALQVEHRALGLRRLSLVRALTVSQDVVGRRLELLLGRRFDLALRPSKVAVGAGVWLDAVAADDGEASVDSGRDNICSGSSSGGSGSGSGSDDTFDVQAEIDAQAPKAAAAAPGAVGSSHLVVKGHDLLWLRMEYGVPAAEAARGRLEAEVQLLRRLSHAGVAVFCELQAGPSEALLLLRCVGNSSCSLTAFLCDRGPRLPEGLARRLFADVVAAVGYLHAQHVVHGRLSPDSILVCAAATGKSNADGEKAADFELATLFQDVGFKLTADGIWEESPTPHNPRRTSSRFESRDCITPFSGCANTSAPPLPLPFSPQHNIHIPIGC
jgi:hypothetical protein